MADSHADDRAKPASIRYAWLVVLLAAWLITGTLIVVRADRQGVLGDVGLSPYHIPAYAGLIVLIGYVLLAINRTTLRGRSWRRAFRPGYEGIALGAAALVGWVILDLLWRGAFGIRFGVEGSLAPTRLLVPAGLALVASGPLREALARRTGGEASAALTWAVVVATGLIAVVAGQLLGAYHPVIAVWSARAPNPVADVSEIWAMGADGTRQTRLLAAAGNGIDYSLPAWSPDGSRIAFTRWQNAGAVLANMSTDEQSAAVWTMAADGTDLRRVIDGSPGQDWIPAWSPDGAWIAFSSSPGRGAGNLAESGGQAEPSPNLPPGDQLGPPPGEAAQQIWIVRPDGTRPTRLTNGDGNSGGAAWSPDGTRLVFDSDRTGDSEIWTINADGTGEARLTTDPAEDWGAAWSSDGRRIAFNSDRTGSADIWVMNADGAGLTQLTNDPANDWVPAWSPDGTRIAFTSDRGDDVEVWSMAVDGSDLRNLTNSPGRIDGQWAVAWSPDGRSIAYASAEPPPADASGLVREDLAAGGMLLYGVLLALVALILVRLGSPFGAFAVVLAMSVAGGAFVSDEWRFVPAALIAGLVVDVLARRVAPRYRGGATAAALPLLFVLGVGLTLAAMNDLGWSWTLLLGVACASAIIGWSVAWVFGQVAAPAGDAPLRAAD